MAEPEPGSEGLWRHYRATWRTMFAIQWIALVIGLSIVAPALSLATSSALKQSGKARLNDTDLLNFIVGPNFPLLAIALLTLWILIHVFGYAVQLFAAHDSYHGAPVSLHTALRRTAGSFVPLTLVALRFLLHHLVLALPFLLVIAGVFTIQLRNHSLQHYLSELPPEFILALAFTFATAIAMIFVLMRSAVGWVFALPLVLFQHEKPGEARQHSLRRSRHVRRSAFITFTLWFIGTPLLVLLLNAGWPKLALWASELLGHRIGLIALLLSVLILLTLAIAAITGFICLTFLSLQHIRLFRREGLDTENPLPSPKPMLPPIARSIALASALIAAVLVVLLSYRWLDSLRIADQAQVIAHRGASAHAPENTPAAVLSAFDLGASWIAIDIRARKDGELVAFADPDFQRIAKQPLKIADASAEDLAAIDVGSWFHERYEEERVPTLQQIITLCSDRAGILIHLHPIEDAGARDAFVATLVDQIDHSGMPQRIRIASSSLPVLATVRELRPELKLGFHSTKPLAESIGMPVDFIIVPAGGLDANVIGKAHQAGIEVHVADTTDPVLISAALSRGADGMLLAAPGIGRKIIEERSVLNPGERLLIDFLARLREVLPTTK
ncbi:MAG: glycerophosphodiester phosphodiesterase family protein [Verrucomicrobiota bacterium]